MMVTIDHACLQSTRFNFLCIISRHDQYFNAAEKNSCNFFIHITRRRAFSPFQVIYKISATKNDT